MNNIYKLKKLEILIFKLKIFVCYFQRAPQYSGQSAGDFADVAYWVLQGRAAKGGIINIDDLNQHFDKIADLNAANDPSKFHLNLCIIVILQSNL